MRVDTAAKNVRKLLPFLVSAGLLGFLMRNIELEPIAQHVTGRGFAGFFAALLGFGALSVAIEGRCLTRLTSVGGVASIDFWTAMRVRCASYLLSTLNTAVGAGALTLLLRRRTGLGIGDAAGVILLIASLDLGILMVVGSAGIGGLSSGEATVSTLHLTLGFVAIAGGLALLRAPFSLGPFDRLREISLARTARETPAALLAEVAILRFVMVCGFMTVFVSALWAFGITIPFGPLLVGILGVTLISSIPIAVSGLGTGQAAFLYFFGSWADDSTLLACSLMLTFGLILLRGIMGITFASEFTREALDASRQGA